MAISGWSAATYLVNSENKAQFQLKLPAGTELGNILV